MKVYLNETNTQDITSLEAENKNESEKLIKMAIELMKRGCHIEAHRGVIKEGVERDDLQILRIYYAK